MNKSTRLTPLEAANKIRDDNNGQVVLVLQGGGALGAYQGGVYQALHEAGIEPDWIIGTSIGAINASVIAQQTGGSPCKAPGVLAARRACGLLGIDFPSVRDLKTAQKAKVLAPAAATVNCPIVFVQP